jgi:hypothetical protein
VGAILWTGFATLGRKLKELRNRSDIAGLFRRRIETGTVRCRQVAAVPYHPTQKTFTSNGRYSAQFLADFFRRYAPNLRERWHFSSPRDELRDGALRF